VFLYFGDRHVCVRTWEWGYIGGGTICMAICEYIVTHY